jgi:hypothetical protein
METLDALRSYVCFLREREGVREVALSPAALRGLAVLGGSARQTDAGSSSASVGSRRPPGDGVAGPPPAGPSRRRAAPPGYQLRGHRP